MDDYERSYYWRRGVRSLSLAPEFGRNTIVYSSNPILERSLSIARDIIQEPTKRYLEDYYTQNQRDYFPRQRIHIKVAEAYVPKELSFRSGTNRYTTDVIADKLLPPSKIRPIVRRVGVSRTLPPYYGMGRSYWKEGDPFHLQCTRSDPYTPNRGAYRSLTCHPWRLSYPFQSYSQHYRPTYIHNAKIRANYLYPQYY